MKNVTQHDLSLSVLFAIIHRMNVNRVIFTFDDEAQEMFEKRFDVHQDILQKNLKNHIVK